MRSRPLSSSWCARRDHFGCGTHWVHGSIRSPAERHTIFGRPASDGASTRRRRALKDAAQYVDVRGPRDIELDAAIHEEVNRLPEKYRAPIVLCDLEGRTHQEAARFLGWPIGTVKSRQSLGRGLIRDRLIRRGLGLAVAGTLVATLRQTAVAAIPKAVSRSTVNCAMQQSARLWTGCAVSARVLSLTQGVLQAMFWTRIRFLALLTLAIGIASSGAGVYVLGSQEPAPRDNRPVTKQPSTTTTQTPQPKTSTPATEKPAADVPQLRLRAQQLTIRRAKALYEIARSTRTLAEIALEEYVDVNFPRDLATAQGEITLAESDLKRAEDRLDWARRMFDKGYVSQAQKVSEELSLQKAVFALEQATNKRRVLTDYTKSKTMKELKSEVDKAHSDELAKQATWELEKAKEVVLERELRLKPN